MNGDHLKSGFHVAPQDKGSSQMKQEILFQLQNPLVKHSLKTKDQSLVTDR